MCVCVCTCIHCGLTIPATPISQLMCVHLLPCHHGLYLQMIIWFATFSEEYLTIDSDAGETLEEIAGMLTDMETIEKSSKVSHSTRHCGCMHICTGTGHESL